jgi:hypothetical protein
VFMAWMRNGAACSAVSHSDGKDAPTQVFEVGAICNRMATAGCPEARVSTLEEGIAAAEAKAARKITLRILDIFVDVTFGMGIS